MNLTLAMVMNVNVCHRLGGSLSCQDDNLREPQVGCVVCDKMGSSFNMDRSAAGHYGMIAKT